MGVLGGYLYWKVVLEFWFGHPKCHFWYPPKRPFWVFLAILGVPKRALGVPKSKLPTNIMYGSQSGRRAESSWIHQFWRFDKSRGENDDWMNIVEKNAFGKWKVEFWRGEWIWLYRRSRKNKLSLIVFPSITTREEEVFLCPPLYAQWPGKIMWLWAKADKTCHN